MLIRLFMVYKQWLTMQAHKNMEYEHKNLAISYITKNFLTMGAGNGGAAINTKSFKIDSFDIHTSYSSTTYVISVGC